MNGNLKRALRRVARRLRLLRACRAVQWALTACAGAGLGWMLASFLWPIEALGVKIAICAMGLFFVPLILALVWPVTRAQAARRADICGLQERARTAIELDGKTDMERLQMADAIAALNALDVRHRMPVRWNKTPLILAGILLIGCGVMAALPNPQQQVLEARADYRERMESQAVQAETLAETLSEDEAQTAETEELNRQLRELARNLRQSENRRETLSALDEARSSLERLRRDSVKTAADALSQAGMESLSQAIGAGDAQGIEDAAQEAAAGEEAQQAAQALDAAAQAAGEAGDAALSEALSALSQAIANGNVSAGQAGTLAQAAQSKALASAQSFVNALKATAQGASQAASGEGQSDGNQASSGQGQGSGGQSNRQSQSGNGAGKGSTNQDQGITGETPASSGGSDGGYQYKVGQYEQIYDPTRLGDGGESSQVSGEVREGEDQQIDIGPGAGGISGYVPYDQVVGEYAASAASAAEADGLPESAKKWVNDYFSALTK